MIPDVPVMSVEVSYCIVNTEQRVLLERCLDAIADCARVLPLETPVGPGHTVSCIRRGSQGLAA